jgi:hypothetical protein
MKALAVIDCLRVDIPLPEILCDILVNAVTESRIDECRSRIQNGRATSP